MAVVMTKEGKLQGRTHADCNGKIFYSFLGVPYATPPVGSLRFRAPVPAQPWTGIRDATREGQPSLSQNFINQKVVGSEDCLVLNVFTSYIPTEDNNSNELKPVMFFIHGGFFTLGSSKLGILGPEILMTEDIVLITFNYRLGFLGFLSLEDTSLGVPGNAGFKDMVMALKWVQRNITNFGGDPNNVTVFGQSAGANAAHLLTLSPMAKGLFHKVICQSGSALSFGTYGKRSAGILAKELGFYSSDDKKILEFLEKEPYENIVNVQFSLDQDYFQSDIRHIGFVVERPNEEAFLTEAPIDVILSGNYNHVPMIFGNNVGEAFTFKVLIQQEKQEVYSKNFEIGIPYTMNIHRGSPQAKMIARKIKEFYFGDETPAVDHIQFYNYLTDICFHRFVYSAVRNHVESCSKCPIYYYTMSLETKLNCMKILINIDLPGATHGDDLFYFFHTKYTPSPEPGSVEDLSRRRLVKLWTNFARCGNPTPQKDTLLNVDWKPAEKGKLFALNIDEELKMEVNPTAKRMAFWDEIYAINPYTAKL